MTENENLLGRLLDADEIRLQRSGFLDSLPPPLAPAPQWDRVEGMLLGLAIGDSLGNTTEGQVPAERTRSHGEIRDYLPNRHAEGRAVGVPSDDTQLAFWTLEQLLCDGRLNPAHLAARFCREQIFGIGQAVKAFVENYHNGLRP